MSQRDLMQLFGGLGSNASNLTALLGNHAAARGGANRPAARQDDAMEVDVPAAAGAASTGTGAAAGATGTGTGAAAAASSTVKGECV